jgi:succinate-semialdehyde dehydrogenase/glutarate-semialdehyde dehydrogenase
VKKILGKIFINTGQNCLSINRILVQEGIHDKLVVKLTEKVEGLRVGLSHLEGIEIGPLANQRQLEKVSAHVEDAVSKGARLLCGGRRPTDRDLQRGFYYLPTVLDGVTTEMRIASEETFGPVAPVMTFGDQDEAVAIANSTRYGLIGYVLSGDVDRAWRVAERLDFGVIGINDLQPMMPEAPVCGWKESGLGVKGSRYGLYEFMEFQYVGVDLERPT